MSHERYLPLGDNEKSIWLDNFAVKIAIYASKYGISSDEVTDTQAGNLFFAGLLKHKNQIEEYSKKLTAYKNEMRDGSVTDGESLLPTPPVVSLGTPVNNGIFKRATNLANRIKGHLNYTPADGMDLGLIGSEITTDSTATCEISLRLAAGGHPEIVWKKQGFTSIEIWADRIGSGKFERVDVDFQPNYIDKHPLPAPGTSEIWAYKAIYRKGDEHVGQWSSIKTISVSGTV